MNCTARHPLHRRVSQTSLPTLLLLGCLVLPGLLQATEPLVCGFLPFMRATEIHRAFAPLMEYVTVASGHPIRIETTENYLALIQAIGEGRVDLAYLGPASYIQVVASHGPVPVLAQLETNGRNRLRGVIITRQDSPLQRVEELAGKRLAFSDPYSTMGHLIPRLLLLQAGIAPYQTKEIKHIANHQNVILGVLAGRFDAGAVKESVFHRYEKRGLKALAWTPPVAPYLFVSRRGLPDTTVEALRAAFLQVRDDKYGQLILRAVDPSLTGLVAGQDEDYDELRAMLHTLAQAGVAP